MLTKERNGGPNFATLFWSTIILLCFVVGWCMLLYDFRRQRNKPQVHTNPHTKCVVMTCTPANWYCENDT